MKKTFALLIISAILVISSKKNKISNSDLLTQFASVKSSKSASAMKKKGKTVQMVTMDSIYLDQMFN